MCVTLRPLSSFSIRMQKVFLFLFLFLFPASNVSTRTATPEKKVATSVPASQKTDGEQLFEDMQLGGVVNFLAFWQAVAGYNRIEQKSKQRSRMRKSAVRTMLPLSPTKSALTKAPSASILPEILIKVETDTPFYWTGWKKESMTGPASVPS